jgi:UrcA family protein
MKTFTTIASIGAALVAIASATAQAGHPQIRSYQRNATVYVADLDLTRRPDADVLYERIGHAARSICATDELSFDTKKRRHWRQCAEAAIADAVDRVNAPLLTAIHLQQRAQLARL